MRTAVGTRGVLALILGVVLGCAVVSLRIFAFLLLLGSVWELGVMIGESGP